MSKKHKRGWRENKFCTVPVSPKNCGDVTGCADYIDVCKPVPEWTGHAFDRIINYKLSGPKVQTKQYEAHHIVCVGPATKRLSGNPDIRGPIRQTEWCINNKDNMMAMPVWGHTVKWYCSISASGGAAIAGAVKAPLFENIPQHDFDHNSKEGYTWEVDKRLEELASAVEEKDHELSGDALQERLRLMAQHFRTQLDIRGRTRRGGTHQAWIAARDLANANQPVPDMWCLPFSMASDAKVSRWGFPLRTFNQKLQAWIDRLARGIQGVP